MSDPLPNALRGAIGAAWTGAKEVAANIGAAMASAMPDEPDDGTPPSLAELAELGPEHERVRLMVSAAVGTYGNAAIIVTHKGTRTVLSQARPRLLVNGLDHSVVPIGSLRSFLSARDEYALAFREIAQATSLGVPVVLVDTGRLHVMRVRPSAAKPHANALARWVHGDAIPGEKSTAGTSAQTIRNLW